MKKLVVVGNGMAGMACVEQVLKHKHDFEITVFGDETSTTRIGLSTVSAVPSTRRGTPQITLTSGYTHDRVRPIFTRGPLEKVRHPRF